MTKIILPCAGLGTRVGMLPHEAKEMLYWEKENHRVIDYILNIADFFDIPVHAISRQDKDEFNRYLSSREVQLQIITPKGEWMDSLLASSPYWDSNNIFILPDTRWSKPYEIIEQFLFYLETIKSKMVIGVHEVNDPTKWCVKGKDTLSHLMLEKPTSNGSNLAFGIIGFEKYSGYNFFKQLSEKKEALIPIDTQYIKLNNFCDITRGNYKLTKTYI